MAEQSGAPITILWTGGWDSTFRVMQALLQEGAVVQPVYLLSRSRPSYRVELSRMEKIRAQLSNFDAEAAPRLLPLRTIEEDAIEPNPAISTPFAQLRQEYRLGTQYDVLARMCRQFGLENVELSVENAPSGMIKILTSPDGTLATRVSPDTTPAEAYPVLRDFAFPVAHLTKSDMAEGAEKMGFLALLEDTWFCHKAKSDQPCGRCSPCCQAMERGMSHRLPLRARLIYHLDPRRNGRKLREKLFGRRVLR
ncbi:7-cyano-7-deazaguanine synthase [Ferrimonas balearica]|uniref:7-cyano-7-deazaguanine synthase n=1 Tax=Ferrimonas balearica TaxID=44012 RepID=UPI001C98FB95|nr:7-cyano-7-deazaguanine synthase [Ferrimonas balearica]MBY5991552.1 7-cyano-7-deazaguanine synthase [Ferrimonas balearica]